MTDKPILFSGPMVRALLDGRKTQTRRILKLPTKGQYVHPKMGGWAPTTSGGGGCFTIGRSGERIPALEQIAIWHQTTGYCVVVPIQIGDRLLVKEAWRTADVLDDLPPRDLRKTEDATIDRTPIRYEADGATRDFDETCDPAFGRLRPGMFMPRWASRLTLTVTDVRVQQLLDITEEDARAEGFEDGRLDDGFGPRDIGVGYTIESLGTFASAAGMFQIYWTEIHPEWDGFSSPWVAAISFTVERRNIDALANAPTCEAIEERIKQ
jgi:hypothetical protein